MPTTLSIRPERLFVGEAPEGIENRLVGTVRETIYLGDHIRVIMQVPGSPEIMVKMQASPHLPPPKPGEKVNLSFRAEDCRALDPVKRGGVH